MLAYASPKTAVALFVVTAVVYCWGKRLRWRPGNLPLMVGITMAAALLLLCKYIGPLLQRADLVPAIAVPLGISYYTFKHIHYLVECSRGKFSDSRFDEYLAYICFFPMLLAGPIERYTNFSTQARRLAFRWADISAGFERLLIGAIKKFVLADLLLSALLPPPELMVGGAPQLAWSPLAFAAFTKFIVTYLDFSGYTDMALGCGRLFGFRLIENFDFPLLRPNMAEYWRSWHISLSSWARDYVYFPVLGRYRSPSMALLATFFVMGVWHAPAAGWVLWGLHHATGLIVVARYHRWARSRAWVQRIRATPICYGCGVVAVWWYATVGHALTLDAGSMHSCLRIYAKLWTFGWLP
jgi:alginate O-acetyltransferase complex protein AlgI